MKPWENIMQKSAASSTMSPTASVGISIMRAMAEILGLNQTYAIPLMAQSLITDKARVTTIVVATLAFGRLFLQEFIHQLF